MGGPDIVNSQETTEAQLQAFINNLGPLIDVVGENILPAEEALLESREVISPQEQQLQADLFREFGPILNEIGADIAQQNAERQLGIDRQLTESDDALALIEGATELARAADPEFFDNREAASGRFLELLDALNPNELSGGEAASVERNVNRTLNREGDTRDSNSANLRSALQFSDRLDRKRQALGNVLSTLPNVQAGTRSGVDTFKLTTGKSSLPSFSQFNPTSSRETGGLTSQFGSQFLSETGQNARQAVGINASRPDGFQRFGQVTSGLGNLFSVNKFV